MRNIKDTIVITPNTCVDEVYSGTVTLVPQPKDWTEAERQDFANTILDDVAQMYAIDIEEFIPDIEDIIEDIDIIANILRQEEDAIYEKYPEDEGYDFDIEDIINTIAHGIETEYQYQVDSNNDFYNDVFADAKDEFEYFDLHQNFSPNYDYGYITASVKPEYAEGYDPDTMTVNELVSNVIGIETGLYAKDIEDFIRIAIEDNNNSDVRYLRELWKSYEQKIIKELDNLQYT